MVYISESFESSPVVTSASLAWQGVRVEQYHLDSLALPPHYHAHHLLMLYEGDGPHLVRHKREGRVQEQTFRTNDLGLYPGGDYGSISCPTPSSNIYLSIDDQHLDGLAQQSLGLTHFALGERFQFNDPLLNQLGRQLLTAASSQHALGLLYVESLVNALCYHLIEHHATHEHRPAKGQPLTSTVLSRINAYLEAHVDMPITLHALAEVANLSMFHFARLFKQTTGVSPYQHVLNWKLQRARQLLRVGSTPVADISDALGFASPANFSAAFKRVTGQSPLEFRRG